MNISQLITKVSLGVALAGTLAVALPSASYAFGESRYYYSNDDSDGTVWDYYRGYFSNEKERSVETTRPRAQAQRPSRRNATESTNTPAAPSTPSGNME